MRVSNAKVNLPLTDYSGALQDAISWLGERYLLAVQVRSRRQQPLTHMSLSEAPQWDEHLKSVKLNS